MAWLFCRPSKMCIRDRTYLVWSGSARRDVVKERPVDSPLDFLPQSTPPTYEEMLSLFSKAGTVSE